MNGSVAGGKFLGLPPLLDGGSQEAGHRGGTMNTAAIVGLGEAVRLLSGESYSKKFCELYSELEEGLQGINKIVWTSMKGADHRNSVFLNKKDGVRHIANVNCGDFLDLPNLADALASRGVAVSAGSACAVTGDGTELSYVLESLGVDERGIRNSVRVSSTKYSTKDDVDEFIRILTGLILEFYSPRKRERSE
jgi:cysteine desulfurase